MCNCKLGLKIGAGVAAIASVAGVVGCSTAGSNSAGAAQGTLSASAKPTMSFEQPSATATASSAATETGSFVNLSVDNFPFKNPDGTVNEGLAAFQKAHQIPVDQFPDAKSYPQLFDVVMKQISGWVSAGGDPQTDSTYANYTGAGGKKGSVAVAGFYDKAYSATLSSSDSFTAFVKESHRKDVEEFETFKDMTTYKNEFKGTDVIFSQDYKTVAYDFAFQEVDSISGSTNKATPIRMVLGQSPGSNGNPVWKVTSWGPSALAVVGTS